MAHQTARDIAARRREARRETYREKLLGVDEMTEILGISRRTWQQWRACGTGPRCHKLPNGRVVCKEGEFERWLETLIEDTEVNA